MKRAHKVLKIGRWVVDFLFQPGGYDIEGVLGVLYDTGASKDIMEEAEDLMRSCKENCGFTFANRYSRRAVVLIGPTSSGAEFLDTFTHEVRHLADAIAKSIGYKLDSEGPAYMTGDTVRELADIVCRLGCDKCRR